MFSSKIALLCIVVLVSSQYVQCKNLKSQIEELVETELSTESLKKLLDNVSVDQIKKATPLTSSSQQSQPQEKAKTTHQKQQQQLTEQKQQEQTSDKMSLWNLPSFLFDIPFGMKSLSIFELPEISSSKSTANAKTEDRLPEIVRAIEKSLEEEMKDLTSKDDERIKRDPLSMNNRRTLADAAPAPLLSQHKRSRRQAIGGFGGMGMNNMGMNNMGMNNMGMNKMGMNSMGMNGGGFGMQQGFGGFQQSAIQQPNQQNQMSQHLNFGKEVSKPIGPLQSVFMPQLQFAQPQFTFYNKHQQAAPQQPIPQPIAPQQPILQQPITQQVAPQQIVPQQIVPQQVAPQQTELQQPISQQQDDSIQPIRQQATQQMLPQQQMQTQQMFQQLPQQMPQQQSFVQQPQQQMQTQQMFQQLPQQMPQQQSFVQQPQQQIGQLPVGFGQQTPQFGGFAQQNFAGQMSRPLKLSQQRLTSFVRQSATGLSVPPRLAVPLNDVTNLPNVCSSGFTLPVWEGPQITETFCRCNDGSYGFSCTEGFVNPCNGNNQYTPADASIPPNYFLECSWNLPYLIKCAPGTIWSQDLLVCAYTSSGSAVSGDSVFASPPAAYGQSAPVPQVQPPQQPQYGQSAPVPQVQPPQQPQYGQSVPVPQVQPPQQPQYSQSAPVPQVQPPQQPQYGQSVPVPQVQPPQQPQYSQSAPVPQVQPPQQPQYSQSAPVPQVQPPQQPQYGQSAPVPQVQPPQQPQYGQPAGPVFIPQAQKSSGY